MGKCLRGAASQFHAQESYVSVPQGTADATAEPAMRRGECQAGGKAGCLWGREWGSEESGETGSCLLCTAAPSAGQDGLLAGLAGGSTEDPYHTGWLIRGSRNVGR